MELHALQKRAVLIEPLRTVVIPADDHNLRVRGRLVQLKEKIVEETNRFGRRNRFVVDVPRDEHGVRLFFLNLFRRLTQYVFLLFCKVVII